MASEREAEAWGWGLTVGPAEEFEAGGGGGGAFVRCCGGADVDVDVVVVGGRGPLGPLGYWRAAAPAAFDPEAPIICECIGRTWLEVFVVEKMLRWRCVLCRKVDDDGLMLNARGQKVPGIVKSSSASVARARASSSRVSITATRYASFATKYQCALQLNIGFG